MCVGRELPSLDGIKELWYPEAMTKPGSFQGTLCCDDRERQPAASYVVDRAARKRRVGQLGGWMAGLPGLAQNDVSGVPCRYGAVRCSTVQYGTEL